MNAVTTPTSCLESSLHRITTGLKLPLVSGVVRIVQSGYALLSHPYPHAQGKGTPMPLGILGTGMAFGYEPMDITAYALQDFEFWQVPRVNLRDADCGHQVAQALLRRAEWDHRMICLLQYPLASQRLMGLLLLLGDSYGRPDGATIQIFPKLTHRILAQLIGHSRTAVTRLLGRLSGQGLIEVREGTIYLLNPSLLRWMVQGENGTLKEVGGSAAPL
jgi:CRP-like cAMP-binding protein